MPKNAHPHVIVTDGRAAGDAQARIQNVGALDKTDRAAVNFHFAEREVGNQPIDGYDSGNRRCRTSPAHLQINAHSAAGKIALDHEWLVGPNSDVELPIVERRSFYSDVGHRSGRWLRRWPSREVERQNIDILEEAAVGNSDCSANFHGRKWPADSH